ncbi:hypothetical protein CMI47_02760 [Candidatus Pacearchaeota archaeon]|nr:hypothetical protein [Candidatus Pacearchaeota archaeon]
MYDFDDIGYDGYLSGPYARDYSLIREPVGRYGQLPGGDAFVEQIAAPIAAQVGTILTEDPRVLKKLEDFQTECKAQAQSGVEEFMAKHWYWFLLGGLFIGLGHYTMLLAAIAQRDARFRRKGII